MTEAELIERLQRLERANRRLWFVAVGALALLAAVIGFRAVYAAPAIPQKIVAHEIDVVDGTGKVRIRLSTTPIKASVEVLDAQGNRAASMEVDYPLGSYILAGKDGGEIAALSSTSLSSASVGVAYSPAWNAAAFKSKKDLLDAVKSYQARLKGEPSVGMGIQGRRPNISLNDGKGYSMDLGSVSMVTPATGETHETSAASIVMFGNDKNHHVIWQAP